jgi:hypothetical protein
MRPADLARPLRRLLAYMKIVDRMDFALAHQSSGWSATLVQVIIMCAAVDHWIATASPSGDFAALPSGNRENSPIR